ncbi:hypothetical protein FWN81_21930 [Salmonella enterica]|nr:hypothetical protein [Salmonella enterica]
MTSLAAAALRRSEKNGADLKIILCLPAFRAARLPARMAGNSAALKYGVTKPLIVSHNAKQ